MANYDLAMKEGINGDEENREARVNVEKALCEINEAYKHHDHHNKEEMKLLLKMWAKKVAFFIHKEFVQ